MEFGRQHLSLLNWIAYIYSSFKSTKHGRFPLATILLYCMLAQKIWEWGTFETWFYKYSLANIHCAWNPNTRRSHQFRSLSGVYIGMCAKHRHAEDEINSYSTNASTYSLATVRPMRTKLGNFCKYYHK